MAKFRFIDLFSGIGGFHQAMENLGGECVLASEIDEYAIETYKANYGIDSNVNIRDIKNEDIPVHDVLCAGFPCQSFSKAGHQKGFEDETRGTLFFEIVRILKYCKTPYFILENVRNLTAHDNGNTWRVIKNSLKELGYVITEHPIIISPHQLGVPQIRERVVILGIHSSLGVKKIKVDLPQMNKEEINFLTSGIIETDGVDKKYFISEHEEQVLTCWDEFIKGIKEKVIGFPVWSEEFGKTYSYENLGYPTWKVNFIKKSRSLYENNKEFIDRWLEKWNYLENFTMTERKFEWQCGKDCSSVWEALIQFRPSGVRVKRPSVFPALVAMVQIPIIGKVRRRLTPREAARLQSFPDTFTCNANDHQAYKQFGNAVNVKVIQYMAEQLFKNKPLDWLRTETVFVQQDEEREKSTENSNLHKTVIATKQFVPSEKRKHFLYEKSLTSTVYVIHEDKVLLHMHKKFNTWFPLGGHLEPNELPHIAAIREVKEESGLDVTLVNMSSDTYTIGRVERVPSPYAIYHEGIGHEKEYLDFIYIATTTGDNPISGEGESNMFRWFSLKELMDDKIDIKIHVRNTAIKCLEYLLGEKNTPLFSEKDKKSK